MRAIEEIRVDIIEESKNYLTIQEASYITMIDADTDAPGTAEVMANMKERLRALYEEMLVAYKREKAAN